MDNANSSALRTRWDWGGGTTVSSTWRPNRRDYVCDYYYSSSSSVFSSRYSNTLSKATIPQLNRRGENNALGNRFFARVHRSVFVHEHHFVSFFKTRSFPFPGAFPFHWFSKNNSHSGLYRRDARRTVTCALIIL